MILPYLITTSPQCLLLQAINILLNSCYRYQMGAEASSLKYQHPETGTMPTNNDVLQDHPHDQAIASRFTSQPFRRFCVR